MVLLTVLRELFAYYYWARDRQFEACSVLSQEQFERPLGNSFSSVRHTLAHLVGAEWLWLERLNGRSPESLPAAEEFPTLKAISQRWRVVELGFLDYLAALGEEELSGLSAIGTFAPSHGAILFG
jgi:uncharacterized damage-inducible protein DinB